MPEFTSFRMFSGHSQPHSLTDLKGPDPTAAASTAMLEVTTQALLVGVISTSLCVRAARATDFTWNAPAPGNGLFASPINWSPFNIFVPILGPPGPGEMATFDLGNSAYNVTFNNNHTNSYCRIGDDAVVFNLGGFAYLLNPGATSDAALTLGYGLGFGDQCSLSLTNGAVITPSAAVAAIAGMSSAQLTVGAGAQIDVNGLLDIGVRDTGTLMIQSGGMAYCDSAILGDIVGGTPPFVAAGNGTAIVTGSGSLWTIHGNLLVGKNGPGVLNILDGADVTANGQSGHTVLADLGATGTILVSGAGSTLTAGEMILGYEGLGTVSVAAGGRINSGSISTDFGAGVVNVDGAGSLWASSGLFGFRGPITITNAGEIQCAAAMTGNNQISVSGPGSKLTVSGALDVGSEFGAVGLLNITSGAEVTCGNTSVQGAGTGSSAHVVGAHSSWTVNGLLRAGDQGDGLLEIAAGGQIACSQVWVGVGNGVVGTVTVNGPGSFLDASNFTIGMNGQGGVQVVNGARADGTIIAGQQAGSIGNVLIIGPGSLWTGNGAWIGFGGGGTGTVSILAGGRLETVVGRIGTSSIAGSGTVNVDGAGSTWAVAEDLQIGPNGTGTLNVSNGGVVSAGEAIEISATGSLKGNGEVVGPVDNGGAIEPGASPGILHLTGALTQQQAGALRIELGGPAPGSQHDQLEVTGNISLDGALEISLINGLVAQPGHAFTIVRSTDGVISGAFASVMPPDTWEVIYHPQSVVVRLINDCPPDINSSGAVDVDDLIAVILAWGGCPAPPAPCPADVNGSGSVDVDDLIAVILGWGVCL
jgi:T5SS/PEP-CTERM-associated repeat protein